MIDSMTYKRIFEDNPDGVLIFDQLEKMFHRETNIKQDCDGVVNAMILSESMGARKVIQHIITQINRAHGVSEDE